MLNDGQQYCADRLRLTTSVSKTTTGATATTGGSVVLPDDFILIDKVVDADGNQLIQISKEDSIPHISSGGNVFDNRKSF